MRRLVEWVAFECKKWSIPADRKHIVGHYEIAPNRKTDPKGLNLDLFVERVRQYLAQDGLTIVSAPRISLETFAKVCSMPASRLPLRLACRTVRICVREGVDPAVALAFFKHESSLGTAGLTQDLRPEELGQRADA